MPRVTEKLGHYRTLMALPLIVGESRKDDSEYLDACRAKRNTVEYDTAGAATEDNAAELIDFVTDPRQDVLAWLRKSHPELLPSS